MTVPTSFAGIRSLHHTRHFPEPITEVAPQKTAGASGSTQLTEQRQSVAAPSAPSSFAGIRSLHRSR
jgi:hypothetical protein